MKASICREDKKIAVVTSDGARLCLFPRQWRAVLATLQRNLDLLDVVDKECAIETMTTVIDLDRKP